MPICIENIGRRIYIFGRNKDGTPYIKEQNFQPYFYASNKNGDFKSVFGTPVQKVLVDQPSDVPKVRDGYKEHWEANVVFTNRFLIDNYDGVIPEEQLRICYLDIEIEVKDNNFPNIDKAENMIQCVGCYDNFLKKYNIFAVTSSGESEIIAEENIEKVNYHGYRNEKEMLLAFIQFIKSTNPDILVAWNGDGFDFPYIINRMKRLGLPYKELYRINKISKDKRTTIPGRILFDLMWAYKFLVKEGRESFSLDYISKYELGEGKEEYTGTLQELYENDFDKFIQYNIKDVELLKKLDEKLHIIKFFDTSRRMARCHFNEIFSQSKLGDALLLKYAKGKYALPTEKYHSNKDRIPGAFVFKPVVGLHRNVAVLDWKSLYPNIMITFNLSLEKLHKSAKLDADFIHIHNNILKESFYFEKSEGMIPGVLKELLIQRVKYKNTRNSFEFGSDEYHAYDLLQNSAKVFANGLYGTMKAFSRMSHPLYIASAITTMAQTINKKAAEIAEEEGFEVIMGDTDSIAILMEEHSISEIQKLSDLITQKITEWIKKEFNVDSSTLVIEFEKIYKRILFCKSRGRDEGSKKRYCGLLRWKEGKLMDKIDVTGFENRRSDSPQYIRDFQKNLFEMVLRGKSKNKVMEYINKIKNEFGSLKEELGLPVGIHKPLNEYGNLPQIRACRHSNKHHGTNFGSGSKIKWVYLKSSNPKYPQIDVIAFDKKIPEGYNIDYKKMYQRLIQNKVDIIFDSIGWSDKGKQLGLGDFK